MPSRSSPLSPELHRGAGGWGHIRASACLALYNLSPFNFPVLTVPAGQVAEEAVPGDDAEEEEELEAKKQKVGQSPDDSKVDAPARGLDCWRLQHVRAGGVGLPPCQSPLRTEPSPECRYRALPLPQERCPSAACSCSACAGAFQMDRGCLWRVSRFPAQGLGVGRVTALSQRSSSALPAQRASGRKSTPSPLPFKS